MDNARLSARVHPGARRDELSGMRGGLLQAGLTASDAGADANRALVALLAHRLHVAPERVTIVAGAQLRVKQVRIEGIDQAAADARLRGLAPASRRRRQTLAGLVAVAVVVAAAVVVALSGGSSPGPSGATTPGSDGGAPIAPGSPRTAHAPRTTHGRRAKPTRQRSRRSVAGRAPAPLDPGRRPQTAQLPSARTGAFADRMRGLWAAIAGRPLSNARAAFFPEAAYVQLKAVGDPAGDYTGRLYADYRLDIAAAHARLGTGAGGTRLLSTTVDAAYAHWVGPQVCANTDGYYEVPNSRLVYREGGRVRSIGIASMISWRGVWYVVHLGAVVRAGAGGVVDAPADGPGAPAPSSTC